MEITVDHLSIYFSIVCAGNYTQGCEEPLDEALVKDLWWRKPEYPEEYASPQPHTSQSCKLNKPGGGSNPSLNPEGVRQKCSHHDASGP